MADGFFVTGTGTGVGKTIVAAAIARTLAEEGTAVTVFKPAVTGLDDEGEPDHVVLRRAARSSQTDDQIAPYRFGPAASPHLAAELAGVEIDPDALLLAAAAAAAASDALVCEGVGGFLVPLRPDYLVRDLARDLGLPVVIAAAPGLGTINHTLLAVESVRGAGLDIAGVVLTPWPDRPGSLERSNRRTIEAIGRVRVEVLPELDPASPGEWPRLDLFEPVGLAL